MVLATPAGTALPPSSRSQRRVARRRGVSRERQRKLPPPATELIAPPRVPAAKRSSVVASEFKARDQPATIGRLAIVVIVVEQRERLQRSSSRSTRAFGCRRFGSAESARMTTSSRSASTFGKMAEALRRRHHLLREEIGEVGPLVRERAGERLVERDAERVDVRATIDASPHVSRGTCTSASRRACRRS